ncbi:MAG: transposase, partial [Kiritimatiellia bacterium]|nr:transposase [Kiritimatiellia bacterium]
LYEDLRNKIQASSMAHGDETHWRIDGQSSYLWYAGNPQIAFFHADRSRGSDVASSIFGTAFPGHFIGDSYAAYNAIHAKRRQVCLAHLIRKTKEISERIELMPEKLRDPQALRFCRSLGKLFSICCRIDQRRCRGSISFETARRHIPRLQRVLTAICWQPLQDADAETLRQRVSDPKRDAPYLFTFLETQGVPPTNNHAEQSLRLPVIFRKISFGSRSLNGAQALAVNLSFLATAHRQNRSPIELFRDLLLLGSDTPLSSLYNPASLPVPNSS